MIGIDPWCCTVSEFYYSSSRRDASSSPGSGSGGSRPTTVWERQAAAIQNTDLQGNYLEAMRAEHDPSLHVKTIEGELMGTIGKALGRQGEKIRHAVQLMNREYEIYTGSSGSSSSSSSSIECMSTRQQAAKRYNQYRSEALQARWELTVHRQAAGFIVNNHTYVTEMYPIPPKLPETNNTNAPAQKDQELGTEDTNKETKKRFTGQLDWWQSIGRWR